MEKELRRQLNPSGSARKADGNGDGDGDGHVGGYSWVQAFGFAFLTFNSVTALYHSRADPWNAAFILASYMDLLALFACLRLFERTHPAELERRGALKMAVWILSTVLITMFTYRVADIIPLPAAILVWCMAGFTSFGGFYAFFIHRSEEDDEETSDDVTKAASTKV